MWVYFFVYKSLTQHPLFQALTFCTIFTMKKSLHFFVAILGLATPLEAGLLKSFVLSMFFATCCLRSHSVVVHAENSTMSLVSPADYVVPRVTDVISAVHGKGDRPVVVTLPGEKYFTGGGPLVLTADCISSQYGGEPRWAKMSYENGTYVWGELLLMLL